jgi:hypothetical protein
LPCLFLGPLTVLADTDSCPFTNRRRRFPKAI